MAFQHTRDPYSLDDDNYGAFCVKVTQFLAEDASLPHRPTQFVAEQILRADAYAAALDEFRTSETNLHNTSTVVKAAVDGISAKLLWFKYILPTLIIGPDTLIEEFGLDGELPEEYAKIKNKGDEVAAHWEARKLEPIFAPILVDGDLLAGLLTSYDSAVAAQNTAQNLYSTKSVAKNDARDSHHELEREVFNWFRAHYTDPEADYWVKTPWGKASGGGEESESGEATFPEKFVDVSAFFQSEPSPMMVFGWKQYSDCDFARCFRAVAPIGAPVPERPLEIWQDEVTENPLADMNIEPGYVYYYWVCAVKDGVEGEFVMVSCEYV